MNKSGDLESDGASESIEILDQLADPNMVPGIPVLLSQRIIGRELVQNAGPALRRSFDRQLGLRSRDFLSLVLEDVGSGFPEGVGDRGMVHSGP